MTTNYWNGTSSSDFYDASNWGNGSLPQHDTCDDADITGSSDKPTVAVANAPAYGQIPSLTIGEYGTLKITAQANTDSSGYVFSSASFQVAEHGSIIVDTSSRVELGGANELGGTLTIINNNSNVVLDYDRLSGSGTLNLVNSTLGDVSNPISVDGNMNVTLQGGSTLYAGFYADGGSVTFDPATQNTLVINGNENVINTKFYGVSENTHLAINASTGVVPVSAKYVENHDGSYSLTIQTSAGKTITLSDIHAAAGFVVGTPTISKDAAGDYVLSYSSAGTNSSSHYVNSDTHAQLQQVANDAAKVGGDTSQYSTTDYSYHNGTAQNHFTGTGTAAHPADWFDAKNWSLDHTPQNGSCQQSILEGTDNQPLVVTASTPSFHQFVSLSVMNDATLNITAQSDTDGYVFATQGIEIRGNGAIVVDTPSRVELGGVSQIDGSLTIRNNDGNVVIDSNRLSGGGTLNLDHSTIGSPDYPLRADLGQINLSNDSTFYAGFYASGNKVSFDGSQNTVVFTGYENSIGTEFDNVSANTRFAINVDSHEKPVSAAYSENADGSYQLAIKLDNGKTLTLTNVHTASGFTPGNVSFSTDSKGDWIISTASTDVCFLSGTMIRTDRGDVAVEELQIGDMVAVVDGDAEYRAVTWVGHQDVVADLSQADAEAGLPVRVVAGAIGENLPSRDLLITPEHSLYIDGRFVPARMLVNGMSIFYDRSVVSYRYHHVETEQHSVILAENLPTESYLDTGNRRSFSASVTPLFSRGQDWAQDAAAPLTVARDIVEPLHARLAARAQELGLTTAEVPVTTTDAALSVTTMAGTALRKLRDCNGIAVFELPEGVEAVQVLSRASKPSDAVGPFCDDRRTLGVLVGEVTVWDMDETRNVQSHLTSDHAFGWHEIEHPNLRWTNGCATLSLGKRVPGSVGMLTIKIAAAGPYLLEEAREEMRQSA
ncbi:Hint domain-containing protein [Kozakia baliensis]|uniref:Hint domain-containing protein n=1 Tax=Kozakia baliensis TaxID=153496 RepID=UPI00345C1D71